MYVLKAKKILTQQNQYSKLKKREKYASLTDEKEKKRAKARENYQAKGKEINLDGKRLFWTVFTVMFWKGLTFISHYISWYNISTQISRSGPIRTLGCTQRILWSRKGNHFARSMAWVVTTLPYELQIYCRIQFCSAQILIQASLCDQIIDDAKMIKQSLSILFPSNRWLQQQYHCTTMPNILISYMTYSRQEKKHDELLTKNHQLCPSGLNTNAWNSLQ